VESISIWLNSDKARRALGWGPTLDLEAGLEKTVAFFGREKAEVANP
jgi:nucleoside-diphosphate-sugar epimerase